MAGTMRELRGEGGECPEEGELVREQLRWLACVGTLSVQVERGRATSVWGWGRKHNVYYIVIRFSKAGGHGGDHEGVEGGGRGVPGGGGVSEGAAEVAGLCGHAQCAGGAGACHICVAERA